MVTESGVSFVEAIRQNKVLEAEQLTELARLQSQFPDPRVLAKHLMQRNWLTPYQINQLMAGRGADLVLGQYLVLERLGEGGMGQVFKARHRRMDRVVAVKLIRKEHLNSPDAVKRFKREMQATASLSHPNIVMALDADQMGDMHFFVMEYVEGVDLSSLLKRMGPPPVAQACDYIRQSALGLQHAHEKGMVHRDIKPSNLLVARPAEGSLWGNLIKILDMGVARLQDPPEGVDSVSALTKEGRVVGTPDYMAPEQAANSAKADIRSDLYSLGCTFYHLLSGQVPFPGGTPMEKLLKHRIETPRPVDKIRPEIPPPLTAIVQKLMAKRPEERFQVPSELVAALDDLQRNKSFNRAIQTSPSAPVPARTGPNSAVAPPLALPTPPRRQIKWPIVLGAVALLLAGMIVLALALVSMGSKKPTRRAGADDPASVALAELTARAGDPKANIDVLRRDVLRFRLEQVGTGQEIDAARLLMKLPSPLDTLKHDNIPSSESAGVPGDVVAVLGERRQRHWGPARSVAVHAQRNLAASGGADQVIRLWDATNMQEKGVLSGHTAAVYWVAFLPDSPLLLSAGADNQLRFWDDLTTGKPRERTELMTGIGGAQEGIALAPDGRTLAHVLPPGAPAMPGYVRLLDLEPCKEGRRPRAKAATIRFARHIRALAFSADSATLAVAGDDAYVALWDVTGNTAKELRTLNDCEKGVRALAFSAEREKPLLAAGGIDQLIRVHDLAGTDDAEPRVLKGHSGAVHALTFAPTGRRLASGSTDLTLRLWDLSLTAGKESLGFKRLPHWVNSVAFVVNSTRILTAGQDCTIRTWGLMPDLRETAPLNLPAGMTNDVIFGPGDRQLLSSNDGDEPVWTWDLTRELKLAALSNATHQFFWLASAQDGKTLASALMFGARVQLWRQSEAGTLASEELPNQPLPANRALALAIAPDAKTVAVGIAPDGSVRVCSLSGPKPQPWRLLRGHQAFVVALAFSPDGKWLASGDERGAVLLWNLETAKEGIPVATALNAIGALAFAPDGKTLAVGGVDGSAGDVRLMDVTAHPPKQRTIKWTRAHTRAVTGLAFTPDGGRLASCSLDGRVNVHGTSSGQVVGNWQLNGPVRGVAFAMDGRHLATANGNGTAYVFQVK
ncbi:MAG: protein kinase [Gemmataceae bacterium]|nr:protein kinase [Gemmataceae bacterium]